MKAAYLCGYIALILALMSFLTLLITVAPGGETFIAGVHLVAGLGALCFAALAYWLGRLPNQHWLQQSRIFRTGLAVIAVMVSLLLFTSVG